MESTTQGEIFASHCTRPQWGHLRQRWNNNHRTGDYQEQYKIRYQCSAADDCITERTVCTKKSPPQI